MEADCLSAFLRCRFQIFKMATDTDHMTIHSGQYDMYKVI